MPLAQNKSGLLLVQLTPMSNAVPLLLNPNIGCSIPTGIAHFMGAGGSVGFLIFDFIRYVALIFRPICDDGLLHDDV